MSYLPRKPENVFPWYHAVKRWCERVDEELDYLDREDYRVAESRIVELFLGHARFAEILENGRFLFRAEKDDSEYYFVLERDEIVTMWDKEPLDYEILEEIERASWDQKQKERIHRRLYGAKCIR